MKLQCGCCEGIQAVTPIGISNRPGLGALTYRAGTYATFFETMLARLSNVSIAIPSQNAGDPPTIVYPLRALTTRDSNDPAIALLDAWAVVADVLTFYQERIANEGFLRTATERRSILELARLIGYRLRPGVSASVYLSFTLQKDNQTDIPAGTRAQSVPGPGELPQYFETSDVLQARDVWNNMQPRLTRPQLITWDGDPIYDANNIGTLYFTGTSTKLNPNDSLLIASDLSSNPPRLPCLRKVNAVTPDAANNRTEVTLEMTQPPSSARILELEATVEDDIPESLLRLGSLLGPLSKPPSLQPANTFRLTRSIPASFAKNADAFPRLLSLLRPATAPQIYEAWANVTHAPENVHVYALRVKAGLFGNTASLQPIYTPRKILTISDPPTIQNTWGSLAVPGSGGGLGVVALDAQADGIVPGSRVVIRRPDVKSKNLMIESFHTSFHTVDAVESVTMSALGVSIKTTQLSLSPPWLSELNTDDFDTFVGGRDYLYGTRVYAQSEELALAEEPIDEDIAGSEIELGRLYDGLNSGRWVVVSGERTLTAGGKGVAASELVMLAGVSQGFGSVPIAKNSPPVIPPGEKIHTTISLANDLAYTYRRASVTVSANVAKATHGQTQAEALGSGDGSKTLQTFALHQSPLTYLPAATPAGATTTLQVRVNDVLWHEAANLAGMGPGDRQFLTQADNNDVTSAIFGTGQRGARLPSGAENVKAYYRNGIGKAGNVDAQRISQLLTRPLGVKEVINPLPATGGADRDSLDQARRNAPLAVKSLDRIVSVQDYADFARTYAGIGKASSARFFGRSGSLVHVTIAGVDDIPIATTSDLYANLNLALHQYGDPYEPIQVDVRSLILLIISARVRVSADYLWEAVEPKIRTALANVFGFDGRNLGQDALLSEVISTIQAVAGVEYVSVDGFLGVPDTDSKGNSIGPRALLTALTDPAGNPNPPQSRVRARLEYQDSNVIHPSQLACLSPAFPDCLILREITR